MNRNKSKKKISYLCILQFTEQFYIHLILRIAHSITIMPTLEIKKPEVTYTR